MRPLPRGCLHVERTTNEDRPTGREPAALKSRHAVRNLFLGAGRSTCRWLAPAKGWPVLTLQSCLVQPKLLQRELEPKRRRPKTVVHRFRGYREMKKKFFRIPGCAY